MSPHPTVIVQSLRARDFRCGLMGCQGSVELADWLVGRVACQVEVTLGSGSVWHGDVRCSYRKGNPWLE